MRLSVRQQFGFAYCLFNIGGANLKIKAQTRLVSTSRFAVIEPSADMATTTREERAQAAAMRSTSGDQGGENLDTINSVEIDMSLQKYVLIRAGNRHLVRGTSSAIYHKDAAGPCVAQLRSLGIDYNVLGGGRIAVEPDKKTMLVYGFSYGFPWENGISKHDVAAKLLNQKYPDWTINTSDEGY
uniref:14 kDa phosphohistidine phosphatase n=1 Tax=Aureoumbra lagunensis TaxID=44058 RepID=A0A7S3NK79_9STRA|mmetsp:Transcript_19106/g.24787  ORF Transcript_19106/g.24787 Transcript_19106/m.24787 type:complete len:184 (+) Transcript_19106:47-598(+)